MPAIVSILSLDSRTRDRAGIVASGQFRRIFSASRAVGIPCYRIHITEALEIESAIAWLGERSKSGRILRKLPDTMSESGLRCAEYATWLWMPT